MRRFMVPLLTTVVLFGFTAGTRAADDEIKAILEKAVKAQGGADALGKFKAAQVKSKGKITVPGVGEVDFTEESATMLPDKVKESMELAIGGQTITIKTVFNGDKISIQAMGTEVEVTDAVKDAVKDGQYLMKVGRLQDLVKDNKDYELSLLGEIKVEGKPAVGVRVASKGHKDVSFYFNKETGLIAKVEHRATDPNAGKEFTEERIVLEYQKTKEGIAQPKKILVKRDGEKFMEAEIIEWKMLEKLEDSEFQK